MTVSLDATHLYPGTRIGSTRTSMNTYLQPVVGVLAGVLVLGESLGARAVLAMAVTFAGVATFAAGSRDHLSSKRQISDNRALRERP